MMGEQKSAVWFVGQLKAPPGTAGFEIQGLFSTWGRALSACRDENYFVIPMVLDEPYDHKSMGPEGCYPKSPHEAEDRIRECAEYGAEVAQ